MSSTFLSSPLSLYSIPAVWLTAFSPVLLRTRAISQVKNYNNVQPRRNTSSVVLDKNIPPALAARIERMEGAHWNGNENFPLWIAAILAGNMVGLDDYTLNVASIAYELSVAGRVLYNYIYITQETEAQSYLRRVPIEISHYGFRAELYGLSGRPYGRGPCAAGKMHMA
ncbi:hypothetical protein B0H19DRAFT_1069716 [Mycena capillaripes]|nr:hypothetical protein B0H19DRAFT_1069716 [Mycena capillaripes]